MRLDQMKQGQRWVQRGLVVLVAGALVLAGCGTAARPAAKLTSAQSVNQGFDSLGSQSGLSLTVSLGLTGAQILQLAHATGGSDVTAQQADALSGSNIVIDVATGKGEPLDSAEARGDQADQFELALHVNHASPIDLRYVGRTIYLKADIPTIASNFGMGGASGVAHFQGLLEAGNRYVPGLGALAQGRWVALPASSILSILHQVAPKASAGSEPSPARIAAFEQQLRNALSANSTITSSGSQGARNEYLVTVRVRSLVQQVVSAFAQAMPAAGAGAVNPMQIVSGAVNKIPANRSAVFQVWVTGNKVSEVDLDVRQFDPKLPFAVPVRFVFGSAATVAAPSGAAPLDISKLPGLLGGLFGALGSHSATVGAL